MRDLYMTAGTELGRPLTVNEKAKVRQTLRRDPEANPLPGNLWGRIPGRQAPGKVTTDTGRRKSPERLPNRTVLNRLLAIIEPLTGATGTYSVEKFSNRTEHVYHLTFDYDLAWPDWDDEEGFQQFAHVLREATWSLLDAGYSSWTRLDAETRGDRADPLESKMPETTWRNLAYGTNPRHAGYQIVDKLKRRVRDDEENYKRKEYPVALEWRIRWS